MRPLPRNDKGLPTSASGNVAAASGVQSKAKQDKAKERKANQTKVVAASGFKAAQLVGVQSLFLTQNLTRFQKNHVPAFTKQGFLKEKIPRLLFKQILSKLVFLSMLK